MSKPVALRSPRTPARAKLAEAISRVGKIRDAIAGRDAARKSLPDDLAERAEEISARLEKLDPSRDGRASEGSSTVDPRIDSGQRFAFRTASEFDAPRRSSFEAEDRIQALIDGAPAPDDDLDAAEKEIAALREEAAEIAAREERIDRHNAQVDADLSELRERLGSAERAVKDAAAVVMAAEGGRDALIAAHARAVAIETALRKAIEGAASPWVPPAPQPQHSFSTVTYYANRDALPCLWGTAAERLRTDPDAPLPTIADALARLPAIDDVGAGPSAKNAA
jgi:predicted  nucleic acid-binding Zn-ribbon protein